jgi:hypothetical protein
MLVLDSEWKEIQESLRAKDAHIKALRETMVATIEDLTTVCAWRDARIEALEKRVAELEACICETCHDPECEDSAVEYWRAKAKRFEAVIKEIGTGNALCEGCKGCPLVDAAKDALEAKG